MLPMSAASSHRGTDQPKFVMRRTELTRHQAMAF